MSASALGSPVRGTVRGAVWGLNFEASGGGEVGGKGLTGVLVTRGRVPGCLEVVWCSPDTGTELWGCGDGGVAVGGVLQAVLPATPYRAH